MIWKTLGYKMRSYQLAVESAMSALIDFRTKVRDTFDDSHRPAVDAIAASVADASEDRSGHVLGRRRLHALDDVAVDVGRGVAKAVDHRLRMDASP